MEELKESLLSAPIAHLQRALREQGFLFFRSFFPTSLIEQKRKKVLNILRSENWGKVENGLCIAAKNGVHRMGSIPFYRCIRRLMEEESLHELPEYSPLSQLLENLLEQAVFCHPRKMVRVTYPYHLNPKDKVPPHQDLFHVKGEKDTLIAWIPLGNYSPEEGGLLVAPETHKRGLLPVQSNGKGRSRTVESHLEGISWHCAHYRVGDLLLMHCLTLHQSGKNQSDRFRLSLDCRFSSTSGSVNEEELLPPYYPHVPGWETLCQRWKNPNRIAYPPTVHVHEKEKDLDAILNMATRFAE